MIKVRTIGFCGARQASSLRWGSYNNHIRDKKWDLSSALMEDQRWEGHPHDAHDGGKTVHISEFKQGKEDGTPKGILAWGNNLISDIRIPAK